MTAHQALSQRVVPSTPIGRLEEETLPLSTSRPGDGVEREIEERFEAFVRAHRGRAVGMAWRLLGADQAAAEDVAQEAFTRAFRALPRFRDDSSLSTWFYRILVNEARRHQRWLSIRRRLGGLPGEMPDDSPDPRQPAPGDPHLRNRISDALACLPRGQREAFTLVHLEGFPLAEAARLMGRATGTIKSHLHRATRSLRTELADVSRELLLGEEES
jgi:RNA polymerase sigma-70 factor (ECF subfamily)